MAINKKIIEKYNMFTNVDTVLTDNLAIIAMVPAFLAIRNQFRAEYLLVHDLYQLLVLKKSGNAKAKQETEKKLGIRAAATCGAMKFYAQNENDLVLYEQVKYSPTALTGMRDLELQQTSEALYTLANGLATELVPYNVTASDLTEFNNLVQLYKVLNPKVRAVRVQGKTDLALLWKRITDLNNMLRVKMDNGVQMFQFNEPGFYELYRNARRNYQLPTQHKSDGDNPPVNKMVSEKLPAVSEMVDSTLLEQEVSAVNNNLETSKLNGTAV